MFTLYRELRICIEKAADAVEFGRHDPKAIQDVQRMFHQHKEEFRYFSRPLNPATMANLSVCAKMPCAEDKADVQARQTHTMEATLQMSKVLSLNELVCEDLIHDAEAEYRDDLYVGGMSSVFKGIYAYYKSMTELYKALSYLFQFCTGRGYACWNHPVLNAFATKFVIELQWMESDLALQAMDPKWVGDVGPWTGGGVVTVALRRLEESEIGSVFELDATQKAQGKRIMEAVLLQQQDALATCIYHLADISKLMEETQDVTMPTIPVHTVLQRLYLLIEHLKARPVMDTLSSALFVGLVRILNLEEGELGPGTEFEKHHPFALNKHDLDKDLTLPIDPKDSPGIKYVKMVNAEDPVTKTKLPEDARRALLFVLGLLTSEVEDNSGQGKGREVVLQSLKQQAPRQATLSSTEAYFASYKDPGTFGFLLFKVLETPQFKPAHELRHNFADVIHLLVVHFVDLRDEQNPSGFWYDELETIRQRGAEHSHAQFVESRQRGAFVDLGRSDYQEMLEFAGGFYGAHHVDEAWDRWGHDGGFVELSTRQLDRCIMPTLDNLSMELVCQSLAAPYFTMLTGLAGPEEPDPFEDKDEDGATENNAQKVHVFLIRDHHPSSSFKWKSLFTSLAMFADDYQRDPRESKRVGGMDQPGAYDHIPLLPLSIPDDFELNYLSAFVKLLRRVLDNDPSMADLLDSSGEQTMQAIFQLVCSSVQPVLKGELLGVMESYCTAKDGHPTWARIQSLFRGHPKNLQAHHVGSYGYSLRMQYQNLRAGIEENEVRSTRYPFTIGLLSLLNALVRDMPPLDQELGYTVYLDFIRDAVFSKYSRRAYADPNEKWKVARAVLRIYTTLLDSYVPDKHDFEQDDQTIWGFQTLPGDRRGGFDFIRSVLAETPSTTNGLTTMQALFEIIDGGSHNDPALLRPETPAYNDSIVLALGIVLKLFQKQSFFVKSGQPCFRQPLKAVEEHMLENTRGGHVAPRILNVARYLWAETARVDDRLPLLAINILFQLSKSRKSQARLIDVFRSDEESISKFSRACVNYLGQDDPGTSDPEGYHDVHGNFCSPGSGSAMSRSIVHLILCNLCNPVKREANIAHLLLGFDVKKNSAYSDFRGTEISKKELHRSCLQKILELLQGSCHGLLERDPELCELMYKLIYKMCFIVHTSGPTLQFLRTWKGTANGDHDNFFVTQLQQLKAVPKPSPPANTMEEAGDWSPSHQPDRQYCALLNCQGWFLKTVALEIFATSKNQKSVNTHLLKELFMGQGVAAGSTSDTQMRVLSLFQPVDFTQVSVDFSQVAGSYDEEKREHINQCYEQCIEKRPDQDGLIWCNIGLLISTLERLFRDRGWEETAMEDKIMEIVHVATEFNLLRQSIMAKRNFFDGWRRVVGVTLIKCPTIESSSSRTRCISDLLVALFEQLQKNDVIPDMVEPLSDAIVILMGTLRDATLGGDAAERTKAEKILAGIKNGILKPDSNAKARQNMYGALLFYLQIASDSRHVDGERTDRFMEMVCRDACDGQGIRASLSLSAIDAMVSLDAANGNNRWLTFLQRRGFLNLFVNEILDRDRELIQQLAPSPSSLLPLYLHQAKMTLLNRLALTAAGAAGLAQAEVLWRLKDCQFVRDRPAEGVMAYDSESGSPAERHRELVFPVLRLAISMLESGLGVQRKEITEQVLHFVEAHAEGYFKIVLRGPSLDRRDTMMSPTVMEELSLTTGLIKLISAPDDVALSEAVLKEHAVRIQDLMVKLLKTCLDLYHDRSRLQDLGESPLGEVSANQQTQLTADMNLLHTTANIVSYIGGIMATSPTASGSGVARQPTMLLQPSLAGDLDDGTNRVSPAGTPSLGVLVSILRMTFQIYKLYKAELQASSLQKEHEGKKEHEGQISEARDVALFIIENSLHVLWKHLDWYLGDPARKRARHNTPAQDFPFRGGIRNSDHDGDQLRLLKDEFLDAVDLKSGREATPDSLLKMLCDEEMERSDSDSTAKADIIRTLVRRISDLQRSVSKSAGSNYR
jgi:hypothetical protein